MPLRGLEDRRTVSSVLASVLPGFPSRGCGVGDRSMVPWSRAGRVVRPRCAHPRSWRTRQGHWRLMLGTSFVTPYDTQRFVRRCPDSSRYGTEVGRALRGAPRAPAFHRHAYLLFPWGGLPRLPTSPFIHLHGKPARDAGGGVMRLGAPHDLP